MQLQGPTWAARWAFGFLTGARESEVLGLEWDRVDLDRGLVDISWQLQRLQREHGCGGACGKAKPSYCPESKWKYPPGEHRPCVGALVFTRPKTLAGRRLIPLVPVLVQALNGLPRDSPQGLVFCRPDGKPIDQETDQKAWRDLLVTAGVPHVPQHTIRHSTATLLLEAGVDTHIVRSVIGHSDITTTQQYQHVDLGLARAAWANLAAIMPPQNDC
jgi:integrase